MNNISIINLYIISLKCYNRLDMENEIKQLSSNLFHKIYLWATESIFKSFLVIVGFFIFGVPLVGYLQDLVRKFPYLYVFNCITWFLINKVSLVGYLIIIVFIFILFWLLHLSKELKKTYLIEDSLNEANLNKWSIPLGCGWTVQKCENVLGNMLSVTNSGYPGTLKGAYGWYDYEFSFLSKIDKDVPKENQNFSVVVRSENNLNGVMLQIGKTHLRPHLLFNGSYIRDTESDTQLPTVLKEDTWYKIKIKVTGNNIDVSVDNYKINYKIPTKVLNNVDNRLLSKTSTLKDLDVSDRDFKTKQDAIFKLYDQAFTMQKGADKDTKIAEANKQYSDLPQSTKVVLEFQKGSVGFRESGVEQAYFRNVLVKKCE